MCLLEAKGIFKKEGEIVAINKVDFFQKQYEKIGIAGETGSGKSTLLKIIAGLVQPDEGELFFLEKKILGPLDQLIPGHRGIAYLSQHFELRNNYWVIDFLDMASNLSAEETARIYNICEIDHLLRRRTNQLSGGEKQRIALARLLITSPQLLILDEPFSNLDVIHKSTMKRVVEEVGKTCNTSFILVSHEPSDLLSWADTLILMQHGEIIQQGNTSEVYLNPVSEYAAGLLGEYSCINAQIFNKNNDDSKIIIRPHQLEITKKTNGAIEAVVERIMNRGLYYLIQLVVKKERLLLVQTRISVQIGDVVYVRLVH